MNEFRKKGFSRFERNGIILLLLLILVSVISKRYIVRQFKHDTTLTAGDLQKIALLQKRIEAAKPAYDYTDKSGKGYPSGGNGGKVNTFVRKKDYYDFTIEVNAATAADYERLYGIGKVYAERIVKFRDKLGGFYSIHQIKDVFGIEDSTFQKFKKNLTIKPVKVAKININTATYEELTANPYLFSTVAKQIIGYRTKVQPFESVEEVKNLYFVKDHPEHFDKMLPYVRIN